MNPRLLLDTHVLVRWLAQPKRLSREQMRVLMEAARHEQPLALSAMTLLEIAVLTERAVLHVSAGALLADLESPAFQIIPISLEIAREFAALGDALRDPADRAIFSTARVHGLRLVTSDERIIRSRLVPVID